MPFFRSELQGSEVLYPPRQILALLHQGQGIALACFALMFQFLPSTIGCGDLACGISQPTIAVEQSALRGRTQQRLVCMLAVYIHQPLARLAQLLQGRRVAVDEGARAAAAVHHAPQQAIAVVIGQIIFSEPSLQGCDLGDIELRSNFGTLATGAHHRGFAPVAQH